MDVRNVTLLGVTELSAEPPSGMRDCSAPFRLCAFEWHAERRHTHNSPRHGIFRDVWLGHRR